MSGSFFMNGKTSAVVLVFAFLFLSLPLTAADSKFSLEVNLGMTLFSFSDPALAATGDSWDKMEADLTQKPGFIIGIYGGYGLGALEIGGEFSFFTGSGTTSNLIVDDTTIPDSSGSYDFSMYRIAPVLKYFFTTSNELLAPYVGVAVGYANSTVDIDDPALKFEQGYLDIAIMGGANYLINEQFYMGGNLRVDFYPTIADDNLKDVDTVGDVNNITTDGWVPLCLNITGGYRF